MQALTDETNSSFSELLKGLDAGLVILIDDDFVIKQDDFERIVSDLVCLSDEDIISMTNKFRDEDHSDLGENIMKFIEAFREIPIMDTNYPLVTAKRILLYLNKLPSQGREEVKEMAQSLINVIKEKVDEEPEIQNIFMRYGVGLNEIKNYRELLSLVRQNSVRFYKRKPELEQVLKDMEECITDSQFCIFIVDKILEDEDGTRFVKEELLPSCNGKNVISIIYTSKPENAEPQKVRDDYFVIEIDKSHPEALKQLTDGLALCTYVELFHRLSRIHIKSIEQAQELALSRKDNMIYLASMAHEEGVTPYEAISNWFQLASQYKMARALMTNDAASQYNFLLGLTHFLQEEFLGSDVGIELEKEATIQELNTFEIFDYGINVQCQPPAPGDVFIMPDGQFAILVGQDCDLVVRGSNVKRNAKHADLLRADFIATHSMEKVKKDSKALEFNYFCPDKTQSGMCGVLKVNFEKQLISDFLILDICAFNQEGKSQIGMNDELDPLVKKMLPLSWAPYHKKIQSQLAQYVQIHEFCQQSGTGIDILATNDVSAFIFEQNDSNISYQVQRVCRIKREFRDILLNAYWEYRRRTGINTIGLIKSEKIPYLDIEIGYPGQKHRLLEGIEIEAYIRRSNQRKHNSDFKKIPLFLKTGTLKQRCLELEEIDEETIEIEKLSFTHLRTSIVFKKEILDGKINSIKITLPYRIQGTDQLLKEEKFSITKLLNKEQQKLMKEIGSALYFIFEGKTLEKIPLYNSSKKKYRQIEVDELLKGIIIPDLSIKIKLDDGIICVIPVEKNSPIGS